ncbi:MFS transporter [bacterium]|nr:MFS transporter [bacterium]
MPARFSPASFSQQFRFLLRALRYRNYRLFFMGQALSQVGTWMQFTAMGWLVFRLTDSAQAVGLVAFARQIPIFLFTPFTGVLADRWDRRKMLMTTQSLAMLQAFAVGALTLSGRIDLTLILILSVILGLINSVDMPVRRSLVVHTIGDRADLGNALALNSSLINGGRVVGPTVAGLLIGVFKNERPLLRLERNRFLAVIIALGCMKLGAGIEARPQTRMLRGVLEGVGYVARSPHIRTLLMLLALVSLFGFPYSVLMPVFAREVLGRGPEEYGISNGGVGVGALLGFIYLASPRSLRPGAGDSRGYPDLQPGAGRLHALAQPALSVAPRWPRASA